MPVRSGFSESGAWDSHPMCWVEVAKDISSPAVVMVTARAGQAGNVPNHVGLTFLWVSGLSGSWGKTATTASLWPSPQASGLGWKERGRNLERGQLATEREGKQRVSHLEKPRERGTGAQAHTHAGAHMLPGLSPRLTLWTDLWRAPDLIPGGSACTSPAGSAGWVVTKGQFPTLRAPLPCRLLQIKCHFFHIAKVFIALRKIC